MITISYTNRLPVTEGNKTKLILSKNYVSLLYHVKT